MKKLTTEEQIFKPQKKEKWTPNKTHHAVLTYNKTHHAVLTYNNNPSCCANIQ